jgi:ribosomal protein S18 acetylase RimI-like enzyme
MIIRSTIRADLEDLATLHAAALPRSLFTALGHTALVRYYAYCEASRWETAWTATEAGRVVGACVVSREPDSVLARFVRHAPIAFARELGGLVVRDRTVRGHLVAQLRDRSATEPHRPEITQIFTDDRQRGRGIGAALLRTCETDLRTRGVQCYFVHTERDDNTAGIRFYRREGFTPIGESRSFGRAFLVMQKDLR